MKCQLFVIAIVCICLSHGSTISKDGAQATERNIFAANLYQAIAEQKLNENVLISPAAIQTSMALAYYGAKGKTATEMQTGLRLGSSNPEDVLQRFAEFQQTFTRDNNIRLFNNIYINENLEFKHKFRDVAQHNFDSNVEKADFHPPYNKRTAERINKAVEAKTNSKVVDILKPEQMDDRTQGIIVNAITYSAPWQKAFKADKTSRRPFSAGRLSFEVDTMWTLNNFNYGEVNSLDAKVIELPYQNSDFSMLIILPNKDNLAALVQRLSGKNLLALVENSMSLEKVEVYLPKFRVAFGVNLQEPFKQLGVTTMFTREGDFGNLYRMFVSHYINSANHKAYVDVVETGAEQPLESGGLRSFFSRNKKFDVDHAFVFAIKQKDSIIFLGHISNYAFA